MYLLQNQHMTTICLVPRIFVTISLRGSASVRQWHDGNLMGYSA
nr:MAG TPA: hypothetical protein [Caudoviricetes sp.]